MPKVCYIQFSDFGKKYSYFTGGLDVARGDYIVLNVGENGALKVFPVLGTGDDDIHTTKTIFGVVRRPTGEER